MDQELRDSISPRAWLESGVKKKWQKSSGGYKVRLFGQREGGLNPNGTVSSKKKEQKNFNTPSSRQRVISLHGLLSSQTAAARPAPCPSLPWQNHQATRLPAQRLLLPLALIHNFSHFADRQIQETSDEVPAAGQPPRGLLVVFLAQMRLECFQGKEPSGRSQ